ncbi:MAG TPA: DUF1801 domain-containing protein [Actinomycetota bacterium]|nr:DUF1801 domain-containing protein [Actinomycetota bacterium]
MPERKTTAKKTAAKKTGAKKTAAKKPAAKKTSAARNSSKGFTPEERAAMKERAAELKASQNREESERSVVAKIASLPEPDRTLGKKLHAIVTDTAPELVPRLWYGMPAYAKDGKVLCYFQYGSKFKSRYGTFGFSDEANLDQGALWPVVFGVTELNAAEEKQIRALVKQAVG